MQLVHTVQGLVPMDQLEIADLVEIGDGYRKITTRYFLGEECVRQSVAIDILRPAGAGIAQGAA
jgi:hypothetical protein